MRLVGPVVALLCLTAMGLATAACGDTPSATTSGSKADGELQLFTLNRVESYVEAIPCNPEAICTLAAASMMRDAATAEGKEALLLVVGDSLVPASKSMGFGPIAIGLRARGQVVLEALAAARPDLWLPGRVDLARNPAGMLERAHELGIPTLISNLAEGTQPQVLRSVVKQAGSLRVGFIGLVSSAEKGKTDVAEPDDEDLGGPAGPQLDYLSATETARKLSASLRQEQGVNLVVALSALTSTVNARLAEAGVVDLIVGGEDPNLEAGRLVIIGKSALLSTLPDGREVGLTKLIVRDGNLQMADLSPLGTLPAEVEMHRKQLSALIEQYGTDDLQALAHVAAPGNEEDFVRRFTRLEENEEFLRTHSGYTGSSIQHLRAPLAPVPADHPVLAALGRQGEAIEGMYARLKRPIDLPPPGSTPVIPEPEDCRACHANQVRFWEHTAHAKAYTTISERRRGRDATCLICHTAGFNTKDGWFDPRLDAPRGPVTCYSCHEATAVHSANRIYVLDSTQLISEGQYMNCLGCHQPLRSPGFNAAAELPAMSCPPMRDDEPAIVMARQRAVEALAARKARDEAEPLDDYLMARGLIGLGRGDEGFPLLRLSARPNQDNPRQAIETARLFDAHGRSRDAIEVLRDYLSVKTGDPDVNLEHVRLMLEATDTTARDPNQALGQLDLLLAGVDAKDTTVVDFQLLQVDALMQAGRKPEGLGLLAALVQRHPSSGRVLAKQQQYDPQR